MESKINTIDDPSRRDFFYKIILASLATTLPPFLLSSCETKIKYSGTGKVPYRIWEEILQAIKTSPDYLPQRISDLITSKDPEAMYDFVKNEITLIPTKGNAISGYDLGNGIKWGIDGVLRCGMATPREKVELLNQMYQKAGIESKVVYEYTDIKEKKIPSFFYRPVERVFKPKISKTQYRKWQEEMGENSSEIESRKTVVDYTKKANTLSNKIIETLPKSNELGNKFNFEWDNEKTPTIEFNYNDKIQYAHLFDPKIPFGEKHNSLEGEILKAEPVAENTEKVSLKITYRDVIDYKKEKELINGEWNVIDLIGKQIQLSFLHGLTLEEQIVTPIGNLRTFTPVLALQAMDKDLEFSKKRSFIADPITIDSKRISLSKVSNKTNKIITKSNPELQKEVQKLEVNAKVLTYPIIKLNVNATDSNGNLIEGLSAKDFKITDNNKPVRALLENNHQIPRILILSDASGSMPYQYSYERMIDFNTSLTERIKEIYPSAILDFWKTPSSLFTWLLKAAQTDYDLIIYATDGDNDDSFQEKNRALYQSGPPAIILNVRNSKGYRLDTFSKMAEITNGIMLDASDQEKILEEVTNYIKKMKLPPYVFTYASADNTILHTVKITIDNERLKAKGNYSFPEVKHENKIGIAGIYLELKVGDNEPIKRILAGWDPIVNYYDEPNNEDVDNVFQLLLGGAMLAIEGEGPTFAMAMADLMKSKLSTRKWGEAYLDNDIKKAKEAYSKGSIHFPAILIPMLAPLQDQVTKHSITYPSGYRMCLLKTLMPINKKGSFTFDYLPTSNYQTMAKGKRNRFITNVEKTAQLAIRESVIFNNSTYSEINNANLIDSEVAYKNKWSDQNKELLKKDYRYWNEKVLRGRRGFTHIFDKSANLKSFWELNLNSGELYGIMPDGSGGGANDMAEQLNKLQTVLKMYTAVLAKLSGVGAIGAFSLAVVATYGKTLVQLYAIASEAIIVMDASRMDEQVKNALRSLAFSVSKEILFGIGGNTGFTVSGLDDLISLVFNTDPFSN